MKLLLLIVVTPNQILSYFKCPVCSTWQLFDVRVAGWLLNPDHPPKNFAQVLEQNTDFKMVDRILEIKNLMFFVY